MGSSPLTRGKHAALVGAGHDRGLIPAHAGKTTDSPLVARPDPAHPRSRGENGTALTAAINPTGSSPLTRGKLGFIKIVKRTLGLIPAHAGKTRRDRRHRRRPRAHPRSRGENPGEALEAASGEGSSPLTRGKRVRRLVARRPVGLIPAHAGKTTHAGRATVR